MQPNSQRDKYLLNPPTKNKAKGNGVSKLGTWFSYKWSVYKKPIVVLLVVIAAGIGLYQGSTYAYTSYKQAKIERVEAEKIAVEKAANEKIAELRKQFETQTILTPMTDKDIDEVLAFGRASYLDSIKDLSRAFFSMEYVAKEGKYEVVFETTQREMTEIVNEMNSEYVLLAKFMNTYKNSVRTYKDALEAGNKEIVNLMEKQMKEDMKIYSNWFQWKVSGQLRKTERLKERANRHINSVVSLDGLNKFLQTKQTQIDNLEPFTSLVVKK